MGHMFEAVSDDELLGRRLEIEDARRRLDAEAVRVDAELERRAVCDRELGHRTGTWLAAQRDLPAGRCRARVGLEVKLAAHLPLVVDALARGDIGWEHAEVFARAANPRIVDQLAAVQQLLVDEARGCTFPRWVHLVRELVEAVDQDGGHRPPSQHEKLDVVPCTDGNTTIAADLLPDQALTVTGEIDRVTDQLWRKAYADQRQAPELEIPSQRVLRARALVEICRRSASRDLDSTQPPRVEVVVAIDAETARAETPDGVPVLPDTLRQLVPRAVWRALWLDEQRVPIDLGRLVRLPSPPQRVALRVRDGGCVFPGCDAPAHWTHAHHVDEWDDDDGPTDLQNLAQLCTHHHGVVHRNGWTMRPTDGGRFTFTTPSGRTLTSQRHGRRDERRRERPPLAA